MNGMNMNRWHGGIRFGPFLVMSGLLSSQTQVQCKKSWTWMHACMAKPSENSHVYLETLDWLTDWLIILTLVKLPCYVVSKNPLWLRKYIVLCDLHNHVKTQPRPGVNLVCKWRYYFRVWKTTATLVTCTWKSL